MGRPRLGERVVRCRVILWLLAFCSEWFMMDGCELLSHIRDINRLAQRSERCAAWYRVVFFIHERFGEGSWHLRGLR